MREEFSHEPMVTRDAAGREAACLRGAGRRLLWATVLIGLALTLLARSSSASAAPTAAPSAQPVPVLAYYYIWFDPTSWDRAKVDYPLLGRYSSDETEVMRTQVRWAKQSGIDGFIVSWKSTEALNRRLAKLVQVADEEDFKLSIVYEGLDHDRNPLPPEQVAVDLDLFIDRYASDKAFDMFGKPLVVWFGTWEHSPEQVAQVTGPRRDRLLILAGEKNVADYQRLAGLVDGDAYYWSSVNPETFPGYPQKLNDMAAAVHSEHGIWIAPAAPGFDARLVGGTTVVDRQDGATLRRQMNAAFGASPDAVGLISWNEFSENTYVEPSQKFGMRYLSVLADILGASAPPAADFDSSEPAATGTKYGVPLLGGLGALILTGLVVIGRRARRH